MQPHELKTIFKILQKQGEVGTQEDFGSRFGWGKAFTSEALNNGKVPRDMKERLEKAFLNVDFAPMFANLLPEDLGRGGGSSPNDGRADVSETTFQAKYIALVEDNLAKEQESLAKERDRVDKLIANEATMIATMQITGRGFEATLQAMVIGLQSTTDLLIRYLAKSEGLKPQEIAQELADRLKKGAEITMAAQQ